MKIRYGFVSNSSSSSFVIIAPVNLFRKLGEDIQDEELLEDWGTAEDMVVGDEHLKIFMSDLEYHVGDDGEMEEILERAEEMEGVKVVRME